MITTEENTLSGPVFFFFFLLSLSDKCNEATTVLICGASDEQQRHTEARAQAETPVKSVFYSLKAFWRRQRPFEIVLAL